MLNQKKIHVCLEELEKLFGPPKIIKKLKNDFKRHWCFQKKIEAIYMFSSSNESMKRT